MDGEDDPAAKFGEALAAGFEDFQESDRFKKTQRRFLEGLWDDFQYSVIQNMPEALEGLVRQMTDRAVDALLKGQPQEVRRYLHLDGWTGRDRDHPVIHGRLHENHVMALRRQIAEANEALLRDERINDLNDVVASLEKQVAEKDREIATLRDRLPA